MSNTQAKYQPSILAIEEDLAFSKESVWVYVELPSQPYEFLSVGERISHADKIGVGLQGLIKSSTKMVDCFLQVTSVPFDEEAWMKTLDTQTQKADPSPYWKEFSARMKKHVNYRPGRGGFREKQVFLSVMVGKRRDYRSNEFSGAFDTFRNVAASMFGITDPEVSEKELSYWKIRAAEIRRILKTGSLRAKPVEANTIARLLQETLYPAMPMPDVTANTKKLWWGSGEIEGIATADITNHKKFLRIEQPDVSATGEDYGSARVGYRATLSFTRFPDELSFPYQEPWMHYASLLPYPANLYSRFQLVPAELVAKKVSRFRKDVEDQMNNSGAQGTIAQQEQLQSALVMEYQAGRDRTPWIFGRHRIVVTGPTEEILRDNVQTTIDHYKNMDIDVTWSTGDQMRLLLENQPADKVRVSAYLQQQSLSTLSVGLPTGAGKVGDTVKVDDDGSRKGWLGPYVGYTTSRVEEPCFLSIHSAIAKDSPNGLVVTGSPGGGKSFFAFTLTYIMALQGIWCIYIDPKGDALPIANLPGLEGKVDTFDLKNGHDGLLEPFLLSEDPADQHLMALEVCLLFLGDTVDSAGRTQLITAIREIGSQDSPGLLKVVRHLVNSQNDDARSLGNMLELISKLPFARLCFSEGSDTADGKKRDVIRSDRGLTIISLRDLDLPADSNLGTYTTSNRLAVGIMYLLATFTEALMGNADKSHPKAVIIDEAWAITSTPQGKNMIPRLARMGRALNTALVLVSQNAKDFLGLTNSMSYRCAFRTKDSQELQDVLRFFDLEVNGIYSASNMKLISDLENGECLMKDPDGNISRVKIDSWNDQMKVAFDTNPETRGKSVAAPV